MPEFTATETVLLTYYGRLFAVEVPRGASQFTPPDEADVPSQIRLVTFERAGEDEIMLLPLFRRKPRQL
jgi:hypothetical protein